MAHALAVQRMTDDELIEAWWLAGAKDREIAGVDRLPPSVGGLHGYQRAPGTPGHGPHGLVVRGRANGAATRPGSAW